MDTSALVAVVIQEPGYDQLLDNITDRAARAHRDFPPSRSSAWCLADQPLLFVGDDFTHTDLAPPRRAAGADGTGNVTGAEKHGWHDHL